MARYTIDADIDQPMDVVSIEIEDFIFHNHFVRSDWNGEMVYAGKDRHGKMCFFKYTYVNSILHIEAWMKGSFGGEVSIATGGGSKAEYREKIEKLMNRLYMHSGNVRIGDYAGYDPVHHQKEVDTTNTAADPNTGSQILLLSFAALFLGIVAPIFGLVLGIVAKKRIEAGTGDEQYDKQAKTFVKIAIWLSCIRLAMEFMIPFLVAASHFLIRL